MTAPGEVTGKPRRLIAPVSLLVTVVVAALAVGSFVLLRHDVDAQERALLQNDDSQLVLALNLAISNIGSSLSSLGSVMAATDNAPSLFQQEVTPIITPRTGSPKISVALLQPVEGRLRVILAAGPDLAIGQPLPAPLAAAAARAGPRLSATDVFHVGTQSLLAFLVSPSLSPKGMVVIETNRITPASPSTSQLGPYSQVYLALYASKTAAPSQLIGSSFGTRPLPGRVARAFTTAGSSQWLTLASARHPLVGGASRAAPWLVLAFGLGVALLAGATLQILARRRRYAEGLAAERAATLLAAQTELVRSERLSAVGEMATVIGHELRNPLGASINALYLVRQKLHGQEDPELGGYLDMIERETTRSAALAEDLTAFMRERTPVITQLDLRGLVERVLESTPAPPGIEVSIEDHGVDVQADEAQCIQILTNLLTNAYQAMPDGGLLAISGAERDGYTEITVQDSGAGIDSDEGDRLFEPFVTTTPTGTGLGLAIVKHFVEGHHGKVSIENGPAGGARVTLRLPQQRTTTAQ